jgi:hypothetical protein
MTGGEGTSMAGMIDDPGPLRFELGKIVKQTFHVIADDRIVLGLLAAALYGLPYFGLALAAESFAAGDENVAALFSLLASLLFAPLFLGAASHRVLGQLQGRRPKVIESLTAGFVLFFPLLGIQLLSGLAIVAAAVLFIVPGLMVATAYFVAVPTRVGETAGVTRSLSRSADLTRGYRWSVFGLVLMFLAIDLTIYLVAGYAAQSMMGSENARREATLVVEVVMEPLGLLVSTVGCVVVYFELRRLKEGGVPADIAAVFS